MTRVAIILLTVVAAAVHFKFFLEDPSGGLIYGLNGLGYLGLLGLIYLPFAFLARVHRLARWLLAGYTAATIVAYIVYGIQHKEWTVPLGPVTVVIELTLIVLLLIEARRPADASATAAERQSTEAKRYWGFSQTRA
jgi:hypothetical protein